MRKKWIRGHIGRVWESDWFTNLPYTKQPIQQYEIADWTKQGYDYVKSFSGSMYDNRNPMPDWVHVVGNLFDLNNKTYTFYRMKTLEIMPPHVDHFSTYMKLYGVEYNKIRRVLVMLEDWKPGHYLEIDGNCCTNWIAGDWFMWESDVSHAASNIGVDDRYTLQITGTVLESAESMTMLHWFNIPKLPEKLESLRTPYTKVIREKLLDDTPTYLYMYNGFINELEEIRHEKDDIEYLNHHGIKIYLNEPLCSYIQGSPVKRENDKIGTKHSMWFYSEFSSETKPESLRADELDSILKYIQHNNLTNVTVCTGDYDVEKYYPVYTDKMKLVTDDIFLKSLFHLTRNPSVPMTKKFNKKFICLNWRYTRHRFLIAAYLATKSCNLTWYFKAGPSVLNQSPWLDIFGKWPTEYSTQFSSILNGIIYLNNNSPLNLDLNIKEAVNITDPYFFNAYPDNDVINDIIIPGEYNYEKLNEFYADIFVDVVTESRFAQPTGNYSEKTLQPMLFKKPFILAAPPKTIEYIKSMGFKTFDQFWDESYDDCYDHEERMSKILKVIDYVDQKSIEELRLIYEQMTDILEHNFALANQLVSGEREK